MKKNEIELLVIIEVKPGEAKKQIDLFNKIQPYVLNEKGCLEYRLSRVSGSDIEFVITERWASEEDLLAHNKTKHMIEADLITPEFRAKPAKVLILNKI